MPSGSEQIFFHKGLTYGSRSALSDPGSLQTATNISFVREGVQAMRHKFTKANTTAIGVIHSGYRWGNLLVVGDGTHLRVMDVSSDSDFTDIVPPGAALAIGTINTKVGTGAFNYNISTAEYAKAAAETPPGNDVIPQGKYGAVALDIGADGTIDVTEATGNATGYTTALLAAAGLPAAAAAHLRIGYVTAMKSDGDFTFGTTALNAANTTVAYTSTVLEFVNSPWKFRPWKEFLHCVNGTNAVLIDASKNAYPARVANPASAASGAAGAAGLPSGHYMLYVTYHITYPNGMTYETGLSPASADVNVTLQNINWSAIPLSPYTKYIGTAPTIKRKLYRGPGTGGTIADIYYVTTVANNTTTTYTDDNSDSALQASDASVVDLYEPLPPSHFIAYHYGRCFHIHDTYPWRLIYSEAATGDSDYENEVILPTASISTSWDDVRTAGFTEVTPQALVAWGADIYIALKQTWIRKHGNNPDSWSYSKTWARHGVGAQGTVDFIAKPSGIIGLSIGEGGTPAIAIFSGQDSQSLLSAQLDYLLETDIALSYLSNCTGFCSGSYYFFMYPAVGSSTGVPDTLLVLDLRKYPEIRMAKWTGFSATCGWKYDQGTTYYFGGADGYVRYYNPSSTEAVDIDVQTQDMIGGAVQAANREKVLKRLKYNFSANAAMNLQIIIDGTAATWPDGTTYKSITGTGDAVKVLPDIPQNFRGYRYSVRLYATGLTSFTLYNPWEMEFEIT